MTFEISRQIVNSEVQTIKTEIEDDHITVIDELLDEEPVEEIQFLKKEPRTKCQWKTMLVSVIDSILINI